jgi:hypothetical protein
MKLQLFVRIAALFIGLFGCGEAAETQTAPDQPSAAEAGAVTDASGTQRIDLATPDQSCLKTCGVEARKGEYSACLDEGGLQQECGASARLWYRDCLEERCADDEIQLDDCKTDCRMDGAADRDRCQAEQGDVQQCMEGLKLGVRDCIAACK